MSLQAQQHRSPNCAPGFPLNGNRQVRRWPRAVLNDLDHPGFGDGATRKGALRGVAREPTREVHTPKVCPGLTVVNPANRLLFHVISDHVGMDDRLDDRWPQRAEFRRQLTAWRKREGLTLKEAAERLGSKYATIRQYISPARKDTKPSFELLKRAADLFGVSVWLFEYDPSPVSGSEPQQSALVEFIKNAVGTDLEKMNSDQVHAAYDAWRAIVRVYETKQ